MFSSDVENLGYISPLSQTLQGKTAAFLGPGIGSADIVPAVCTLVNRLKEEISASRLSTCWQPSVTCTLRVASPGGSASIFTAEISSLGKWSVCRLRGTHCLKQKRKREKEALLPLAASGQCFPTVTADNDGDQQGGSQPLWEHKLNKVEQANFRRNKGEGLPR